MSSKSPLKTIIENLFEESLATSDYMKKILNNIAIIAVETKKIAELALKMNDRLNQHEEIILQLINQTKEKIDIMNYDVKSIKKEPSKPN